MNHVTYYRKTNNVIANAPKGILVGDTYKHKMFLHEEGHRVRITERAKKLEMEDDSEQENEGDNT